MSRYEIAEETETHMTVVAKFPKGVTRRQLDVEMSKTSIKVMKKGASQPILEGKFHAEIKYTNEVTSPSLWSYSSDNGDFTLELTKAKPERWPCLIGNSRTGDFDTKSIDPQSQWHLYTITKDQDKAWKLLNDAAEKDHEMSLFELSSIYGTRWYSRIRKYDIPKDDEKALDFLERCAKVWTSDVVHWRLGTLYKFQFPDNKKAQFHFSEAAVAGHVDSSFQLADILEKEGREVSEYIEFYKIAGDARHPEALVWLVKHHMNKLEDIPTALTWADGLLDVISNPRLIVPNEVLTFCENLKDKINRKRDELQADEDFRTGQHLKKSGMIESALSRFSKAAHLGHVQAFVEIIEYYIQSNDFTNARAFVGRARSKFGDKIDPYFTTVDTKIAEAESSLWTKRWITGGVVVAAVAGAFMFFKSEGGRGHNF